MVKNLNYILGFVLIASAFFFSITLEIGPEKKIGGKDLSLANIMTRIKSEIIPNTKTIIPIESIIYIKSYFALPNKELFEIAISNNPININEIYKT